MICLFILPYFGDRHSVIFTQYCERFMQKSTSIIELIEYCRKTTEMKKALVVISLTFLMNFVVNAQSKKNETMNTDKIKVEIWSDVVCPFCLVGKKKMEMAILKLNAQSQIDIIWHSFQLDPDFPLDTSMSTTEYLSIRKGYPLQQIEQMQDHLINSGNLYGIDFKFNKAHSFNTFDVHRLLQWSKSFNKSNELKEAFMVAFFTDGIDLSKDANILEIIGVLGLDTTKAKAILASDEYQKDVLEDINLARQLGIRGVPFFLINGKEHISGAQDDSVFEKALASALKNIEKTTPTSTNGICLPSGECK